jgi:hypothetical protein
MIMNARIDNCIVRAKMLTQSAFPNPDLPGIIGCLEAMKRGLDDDISKKSKLAGALGRLVMEDYAFSASPFGIELLSLADDYVSGKKGVGKEKGDRKEKGDIVN